MFLDAIVENIQSAPIQNNPLKFIICITVINLSLHLQFLQRRNQAICAANFDIIFDSN